MTRNRSTRTCLTTLLALCCVAFTGCVHISPRGETAPAQSRPATIDAYYTPNVAYRVTSKTLLVSRPSFDRYLYTLETDYGDIKLEYYERKIATTNTVVVFPVLGGSYFFSRHFARQFARRGFNSALIRRDASFKDPKNFDLIEERFRANVIQDRVVLSFLESELGTTQLGSFGISRGAINAVMTAGVDARLKCNAFALGGSDIAGMYRRSAESGINKYRRQVTKQEDIDDDEFFRLLEERIQTDPKHLGKYLNPKKTLVIIAIADAVVPAHHGHKLRRLLGFPNTVFILADHYTSILYIQWLDMLVPAADFGIFPPDYIETETMDFFYDCMEIDHDPVNVAKIYVLRTLQLPLNLLGWLIDAIVR